MKTERLGESKVMNCGFKATIIAYRKYGDIDVLFDNGVIIHNKTYTNFKRGSIKIPTHIEYIGDYARCTNLLNGVSFLIDIEDIDKVKNKSFHIAGNGYVVWHDGSSSKRGAKIYLARYIMNCPNGCDVDHINMDILDNRKANLRICSRAENMCNKWKPARPKHTSEYKGVSKRGNKWQATISFNKQSTWLGIFDTEEEAAQAYNEAAIMQHGEFATVNAL